MRTLAAAAADGGLRGGLLAAAFGFGLRHGVDWDHLAAITDITTSQPTPRRSVALATSYACGHAMVVFALGTVAVLAGDLLPPGVDAVMGRVVGVTLLLLGGYVFWSLARHRRDFRMRSRWMLVLSGAARVLRWMRARRPATTGEQIEHDHDHGPGHGHRHAGPLPVATTPGAPCVTTVTRTHRHRHRHRGTLPPDPFLTYGWLSSLVVGMVHGVGAETPTQLLVFLAATKAGGTAAGIVLLVAFVAGLLTSNSAVAVVSTYGFLNVRRSFTVYATVAVVTGAVSIVVGLVFLLGREGFLPAVLPG